MHALTILICGDPPARGCLAEVQNHLAASLDRMIPRSRTLLDSPDLGEIALVGPYLGRAMLEVGMTALLSRFDPMRVLAIRMVQLSPSFSLAARNHIAFDWGNDVQGEGQGKGKEWDNRPRIEDLQRALLGKHFHDLFWEEAFQLLVDNTEDGRGGAWMANLRMTSPEGFTTRMRTEASRLYSQMSKGIHQELVIPATAQFDRATVTDILSSTYELLGALGLAASASPSLRSVSADRA